MKRVLKSFLLLAIISCSTTLLAQEKGNGKYNPDNDPVIDRIIETGQDDNRTTELLDILSNRFGGRLVGSDAYNNAADWCEYMFRKWGLEVWRQEVGELPVGFNRGPWFGKMIGGDGMTLRFITPSYTSGTKGAQRGHVVIEPKTRSEFKKMKGTLKGAWVLIGGESSGWPIDFSTKADSARAVIIAQNEEIAKQNREIWRYNREIEMSKNPKEKRVKKELIPLKEEPALFYKEMKEAGILGIIQSAKVPITGLYDRKNIMDLTFETLPELPDIKLDEDQYKIIRHMAERRESFQLEFDIRNHFKMGPVKFHNIIGVLKGSEYPDEYVMAGGHLDAFDVATGGVDCGVGVTPTMEAARLIATSGGKPKRTILFCLWAAEEFGLWGSKFFVESDTARLAKISNYFNRDGGPLVPQSITVPPAMYDDFAAIEPAINRINPDFPFKVYKREGEAPKFPVRAGGSDHAYFAMNGVPVYYFNLADSKGYNFDYREIWHTDRDLYNKSIPEYQEQASVVTALMLYHLANIDHLLSREGMYSDKK